MFYTKDSPELKNLSQQELKNLLGGKGAGLYWMTREKVNVPPFLVIPTTTYAQYAKNPTTTMQSIAAEVPAMLAYLAKEMGYKPLISVRSGARVSCPGMMDTILNVGLDQNTEGFWSAKLGDACHKDSLHRLVTMYGSVVHGLNRQSLEAGGLSGAMGYFESQVGCPFPMTTQQIVGSIEAVFKSWDNPRAEYYRKMNNIPQDWGTAVTLQSMVFGNLNDQSCTGVLFTRNPDTGEDSIKGEFLVNAQGEDVVAGILTPLPLKDMLPWNAKVAKELAGVATFLEVQGKDVQDIEFTVQDGVLYVLQTRAAKRTPQAAVRIALDLHKDGILTRLEALRTLTPQLIAESCISRVDPAFKTAPDYQGLPACSGVVTGLVCLDSAKLVAAKAKNPGTNYILVSSETTPDDIAGMHAAVGILTMSGGSTSHAAVVARSMNRACIVGLGLPTKTFTADTVLTMDGATGRVWKSAVPVVSGDTDTLDEINDLLMLGTTEVSEVPPATMRKEYVLDLSLDLLLTPLELSTKIQEAQGAIEDGGKLYLSFMNLKDAAVSSFYQQFMVVKNITSEATSLVKDALLLCPATKNIYLIDIAVPGIQKISTVELDLQALALLEPGKKTVLFTPATFHTGPDALGGLKAIARVMTWLEKDGVDLKGLNVFSGKDGSMAARSRVAAALLG